MNGHTLIILPSYNESDNIVNLIDHILSLSRDFSICVVDDSSPDGTADLLKSRMHTFGDRFHLIVRSKKDGRGGAVRDGLCWGVGRDRFDYYVEMDCDFSHHPDEILTGITYLKKGYDVVLGSRYPNGTIIGWPIHRRIFSILANTFARALISRKIADYTNGFRFYNRASVKVIVESEQRNKGYIYLSEVLSHFLKLGFRIKSFPIVFKNRERGSSNTSVKEIFSAFTGIIGIARSHHRS